MNNVETFVADNTTEVISYVDKANTRLRSRYYKFIRHGKARNVAVAAKVTSKSTNVTIVEGKVCKCEIYS